MSATSLISVEGLVSGYEPGLPIIDGVSMSVERGEVVAVLGPNGAGKSTLIKSIAGFVPVFAGRVLCDGEDLEKLAVHERVRKGIAYVPQINNVFANLTVSDNLRIAAQLLPVRRRAAALAAVREVFPDLSLQWSIAAGRLSGGQRQMLAMARALIVAPKLLLLDEPSAGLAPKAVGELFGKLADIRQSAGGIVLVEQNVKAALAIADRAYILVDGRTRREGNAGALASDPQIAGLYLDGNTQGAAARGAH